MSGEQTTTAGDGTAYRIPVSSDDGGPATVFEHLWTPYRMAYIRGEGKPTGAHDCPFCVIPTLSDEEGLIVARGTSVFAVLNLYPYNAGHLIGLRDLVGHPAAAVFSPSAEGSTLWRAATQSAIWATASATGTPLRCEPSR